jgi:DNA polymerase-3 subunit beta
MVGRLVCHDSAVNDERLLTISTFARAVGIPGSALRFYATEGVLVPAEVDSFTGYRYYAPSQIEAGVLVRRMRATAVPVQMMKDILEASAPEATHLIDRIIATHSAHTRQRELDLAALRESIHDAAQTPQAARAVLPGTVLASAIGQVIAATSDATEDVSGLVWALHDGHLELIATDRYWLAYRELRLSESDGEARVMTTPDAAAAAASACGQRAEVSIEIVGSQLRLRDPRGEVVAEASSIERSVPDLSLLISTQPQIRAIAGFASQQLEDFLQAPTADGHVLIDAHEAAIVGKGDQRLQGWVTAASGDIATARIQMQSALLASAVSICQGPEVLLGLVDETTPVRVQSPFQDAMTCLVMPMRP